MFWVVVVTVVIVLLLLLLLLLPYCGVNISYRPHIKDHGSCDVSVSGVSMSVTADVGVDTNGHATLSASGCSLDIGHVGVKFHGGARFVAVKKLHF